MNSFDFTKYVDKIKNNTSNTKKGYKNYFKNICYRILIVIVIFLIGAILIKNNSSFKETIYNNLYNKNISFVGIKNIYNKYLGGIVPIDKLVTNIKPVFNEKLVYDSSSKYHDGVALKVATNYLVPILESGLVIYVGEKENYGNVIIIQGIDNIDIWYGNISTTTIKLYDYVEKGQLLGEIKDDNLYLVYAKDGNYLNYEEYLK